MHINTDSKHRQVPDGYLVAGIDPHKKTHTMVIMTRNEKVLTRLKFNNSKSGFELAVKQVDDQISRSSSKGVIFAMEAGGHYWRNLAYFLHKRGMPFCLVNPFTAKRIREGKDINRAKNDMRDARVMAEIVFSNGLTQTNLPQGIYAELRAVYNAYQRLIKERSRIKNRVKSLLDQLFPEFCLVFNNVCSKTAMQVLSCCLVPSVIARMQEDQFIARIREGFTGRALKIQSLQELYRLAKSSIGAEAGARGIALELSLMTQQLLLLSEQIEQTKNILQDLLLSIPESRCILSIQGVGHVAAAGILAETGPLQAYRNAGQLIKLAGTNPTSWESAGKRHSITHMSKKGRPRLRSCLWIAAISLLRSNPDFKEWARARRERELHMHPLKPRETVGAVANRLLRIVYALVKNGSMYCLPQANEVLV